MKHHQVRNNHLDVLSPHAAVLLRLLDSFCVCLLVATQTETIQTVESLIHHTPTRCPLLLFLRLPVNHFTPHASAPLFTHLALRNS